VRGGSPRAQAIVEEFLLYADDSIVAILPYALAVAARLGVADQMAVGNGTEVTQLAAALEVDADSLYRLLRALASCGLFERTAERAFALTELGQLLRSDSSRSQRATLVNLDSYRAWLLALDSLATGRPAFNRLFDATFFGHKEADPVSGAQFDMRMRERSARLYRDLVAKVDFSDARSVADIGGGSGTVLASVLTSAPHLRGVLFDRPEVVERARDAGPLVPFSARCSFVPGDFFTSIPTGATVHLMCSVLHDWNDQEVAVILRNSHRALEPGGRLVLCEMVVPEHDHYHPAKWSDLGMMVVVGGRERTAEELEDLLSRAGFHVLTRTESATAFSLIEAQRIP
jgi:ubiquinone/menaquinone biosynthesis C-methylase UbiE